MSEWVQDTALLVAHHCSSDDEAIHVGLPCIQVHLLEIGDANIKRFP